MGSFFAILLAVHITLAIAVLLPAILLPFLPRGRAVETEGPAPPIRALLALEANGSFVIGLGLALTGAALVLLLGVELLGRP